MGSLASSGHVFVSHANADKARLRRLVEVLLDENFPLWIDRPEELGLDERFLRCGRIRSGTDWQGEIDHALQSSACVLFVLSHASNAAARSDALFREFQHGVTQDSLVMVAIDPLSELQPLPQYRIRQTLDLSAMVAGDGADRRTQARLQLVLHELRDKLAWRAAEGRPQRRGAGGSAGRAAAGAAPPERDGRLPRLVPYLTDRIAQQRHLAKVVQEALRHRPMPPLTFVAHGLEDDCLDSFVEQVRYTTLPGLLAAANLPQHIVSVPLIWPFAEGDAAVGDEQEVHALVAEALRLPAGGSRQEIADHLAAAQACWQFHLSLDADAGARRCCQAVHAWAAWWSASEFRAFAYPVITIVCIALPSAWLLRLATLSKAARIRRGIQAPQPAPGAAGAPYLLPAFRHLRFGDVEATIHTCGEDVDREVLRRRLRRAFTFARTLPGRRMSMYEAANLIKRLIDDPQVKVSHPA